MKISGLALKTFPGKVRIQAEVKSSNTPGLIWFELEKKYKDFLIHDRFDALAIMLLSAAMAANEPIYIEGDLSTRLFSNLLYYLETLKSFYPGTDKISIYPNGLNAKNCDIKKAQGASFMLNRETIETIQDNFGALEYLLYVNVGEYYPGQCTAPKEPAKFAGERPGKPGGSSFEQRVQKLKNANDTYLNKELIAIDSNLEMFAQPQLDPELTFGTMTIGAALLLQGLLSGYYMPAAVYDYNIAQGPIPLPWHFFITDTLEIIHDNPRYTRPGDREATPTPGNLLPLLNRCGIEEPREKDCTACRQCISSMISSPGAGYKEIFFNVFAHTREEEKSKPGNHPPKPFVIIPGAKKSETMTYDNYDVTVIMPFYKKYHHFVRVFPAHAGYFTRPGIEVIIVMDEPGEEEKVLDFIRQYTQVNWIIIVNDNPHEWRNPSKALNVGIKHASKKYILVVSPESEMVTDVLTQFKNNIQGNLNFCIGQVHFMVYGDTRFFMAGLPYGSIMVSRENLIKIGGYDESFSKWGADDDNLRVRLKMIGARETFLPEAHIFHWEEKKVKRYHKKPNAQQDPIMFKLFNPGHWLANNGVFGNDFNRIAYDYRKID